MKKTSEIIAITRPRKNGMYTDTYTVKYQNGGKIYWKEYTIKTEMMNKHFDFIMNAHSESIYNQKGAHIADRFTA